MRTLLVALILATVSAGAAAQAYRWVDEKGKVHYGDRPPSTANVSVPGTRSAKPRSGDPVTPGMKPDEVQEVFGRPDQVRKVSTRAGEVQYWTYRKPKGETASYTIKFENGTVSEVSSEPIQQAAVPAAPQPLGAGPAPSAGAQPAATGPDPSESQAKAEAAARARQCASVRDSVRSADDSARRGGSVQAMDRLREDRRRNEQKLNELGC